VLRYYDSHIRTDCIEDDTLANLAYFNVTHVLLAAHAPREFRTAEELLTYFGDLVTTELHRLARVGLHGVVALGVHPDAVPRRAHPEVWQELPSLLADPKVVAVGELSLGAPGSSQEALLERQLVLAESLEMPVLVTTPSAERARKVRRALEIVRAVGVTPERVLVNHVDYTCLRPVLDAGCWAGVTLGPLHSTPEAAVALLEDFAPATFERVILNSGLRPGPIDVLALPRVALTMSERGLDQSAIRRLVFGNAQRLFGPRE
jgi:predicted metal-dependent TIM-barrel fold hydrolase